MRERVGTARNTVLTSRIVLGAFAHPTNDAKDANIKPE